MSPQVWQATVWSIPSAGMAVKVSSELLGTCRHPKCFINQKIRLRCLTVCWSSTAAAQHHSLCSTLELNPRLIHVVFIYHGRHAQCQIRQQMPRFQIHA